MLLNLNNKMSLEDKIKELSRESISKTLQNEKYDNNKRLTLANRISSTLNEVLQGIFGNFYDYSITVYLIEKGSTYIFNKTSCLFDNSKDKHVQQAYENESWICITSVFLFWSCNRQLGSNEHIQSDLKNKIRKVCQFQLKKLLSKTGNMEDLLYSNITFICDYIRDIVHIETSNYAKGLECLIMKNDSHGGSTCWSNNFNDQEDLIVIYSTQHSGYWCVFFVTLIRHS